MEISSISSGSLGLKSQAVISNEEMHDGGKHSLKLRRDEADGGEVCGVAACISCEQRASQDGGVGADEEIGEDVVFGSTLAPVNDVCFAGKECGCSRDFLENEVHGRYLLIQER